MSKNPCFYDQNKRNNKVEATESALCN